MSGFIAGEDVQRGDKIRVCLEFTVLNTTFEEDREIRSLEHNDWVEIPEGATIELIKRPVPDLPTKTGSVVNVSVGDESCAWMLHSSGFWNSALGGVKDAEDFKLFLEQNFLTFEVLL